MPCPNYLFNNNKYIITGVTTYSNINLKFYPLKLYMLTYWFERKPFECRKGPTCLDELLRCPAKLFDRPCYLLLGARRPLFLKASASFHGLRRDLHRLFYQIAQRSTYLVYKISLKKHTATLTTHDSHSKKV